MNLDSILKCCFPKRETIIEKKELLNEVENKSINQSKIIESYTERNINVNTNKNNSVLNFADNNFISINNSQRINLLDKVSHLSNDLNDSTRSTNYHANKGMIKQMIYKKSVRISPKGSQQIEITSKPKIIEKKLILTEIEGNSLKGSKVEIYPTGILNSVRNACDGKTYFGNFIAEKDGTIINDCLLDISSHINKTPMQYFVIYNKKDLSNLKLENQKYLLKSLMPNDYFNLILLKIQSELEIKLKQIIKIDYFYLNLIPLHDRIQISVMNAKDKNDLITETYEFQINDIPIYIGRSEKCHILLPESKSFSRIHATISYNNFTQTWNIKDGGANSFSTNGTWLYIKNSFELENNMIFRIMNSIFKVNVENNIIDD